MNTRRRPGAAIGALTRFCATLLLAASCGALAEAGPRMIVHLDAAFDSYSPLASSETLPGRVMSPLLRERVRVQVAATAQPMRKQSIDLADERFSLYVPAGAPPAQGYGLLVFVPPWDAATIPAKWLPVLSRHQLIAVVAAKSGNDADVFDRRMPLALSGYENVSRRYPLASQRVYIGGMSGGSRVALRLALAFPDVFRGALLNAGSDPIGTSAVPLPDAALFRQFEEHGRLVYATGDEDAAVMRDDRHSRDSVRDLCFSDVVTLTMRGRGHEPADPATLERALDALDMPRKADPKMQACRAARDRDIVQRLAGVGSRIDAGDLREAARQLEAIDAHFGGLAAPTSVQLARRLATTGNGSATRP